MDKDKVLVAVYGTLMTGERNEHWRTEAGCRLLGRGVMHGAIYDTGYGFPAFVPSNREDANDVACEVLETDWDGIAHMDILEGYPRLYRREEVCVNVAGHGLVNAIVYVMQNLPKHAMPIAGGNWTEYREAVMPWTRK